MKLFGLFIIGFLLGAGIAAAAVYYNPLTAVTAPALAGEDWLLYDSPVANNLVLAHDGNARIRANPAGIPELWESTLEGTVLLLVELRNADGSLYGVGSRISVLAENTDLLRRGVGLQSHWAVSAPGRGIFFVIQEENIWPVLKEVVLPAYYSESWRGSNRYTLTTGPLESGYGLLLGATGEFREQRGRAVERYEIRRYSRAAGPVDMSAELGIRLPRASDQRTAVQEP